MVSPKLAHSGNAPALALRTTPLAAFAALEQAIFKFVARTPGDLDEVAALAARHAIVRADHDHARRHRQPDPDRARRGRLADAVLTRGYGMSDRLHIHLFGDTRGT